MVPGEVGSGRDGCVVGGRNVSVGCGWVRMGVLADGDGCAGREVVAVATGVGGDTGFPVGVEHPAAAATATVAARAKRTVKAGRAT